MSTPKKIAGTMVIPVLTFLILEMICMAHGNNIIIPLPFDINAVTGIQ